MIFTVISIFFSCVALLISWLSYSNSRKVGEIQSRPYVEIISATISYPSMEVYQSSIGGTMIPVPKIQFTAKNFGSKPARNFCYNISVSRSWFDVVEEHDIAYEVDNKKSIVAREFDSKSLKGYEYVSSIPPGIESDFELTIGLDKDVSEIEAIACSGGKKIHILYVLIDIYYNDLFGRDIFEKSAWWHQLDAKELGRAAKMKGMSVKQFYEVRES